MNLPDRFEILALERDDDGVKTYAARERATGRSVKVHVFENPRAPLQLAMLREIDHLSDSERARVIDRGKHEGTTYLVTDPLDDFPGLREWVQIASRAARERKSTLETAGAWRVPPAAQKPPALAVKPPAAPEATPPAPPATPPAGPAPAGDSLNQQFAALFATAERPVFPPENSPGPQQTGAPLRADQPTPKPADPAREAGEFTRMFQAPVAPATQAVPAAAPGAGNSPPPPRATPVQDSAPAPSPAHDEPGEFTRMFFAPKADIDRPGQPPQAPDPGEFTRMFQAAKPPAPQPAPPSPSSAGVVSNAAPPANTAAPSNAAPRSNMPSVPPSEPSEPGEFTRMFQVQPPSAPPVAPSPAAPPPAASEPGEFTRMFQAPKIPAVPPSSTPPATGPFAAPPPSMTSPSVARPPLPQQPPAQAPPARNEPGEFTRMFQAAAPPPGAAPAPGSPPGAAAPGDFTKFFETPSPAGPMPASPQVHQPLSPQAPGSSGHNRVGEFTRMFGRPDLPPQPEAAPMPQPQPGQPLAPPPVQMHSSAGATQAFSAQRPAAPAAPPAPSGPGEYTRMFSAPAAITLGQNAGSAQNAGMPPAAQPPAAPMAPISRLPTAPAPAAPKSNNLPLILGIVGIIVLAALVIAFFALRPH